MSFFTDLEDFYVCTQYNYILGSIFIIIVVVATIGQIILIYTMVFMGIFNLLQLSAQFLYCIYVLGCVMNRKQESSWADSIIGPFNKIYFNMSEYYNLLLALNRLATFMIHRRTIVDKLEVIHKVMNFVIFFCSFPFYIYHFAPGCFCFYSPFLWEVPDPCEYWDVFDFYTIRIAELLFLNLMIYVIMLSKMVYLRVRVLEQRYNGLNIQERRVLLIAIVQFLNSGIATFYNRMFPGFYNYTSAGRLIFRFLLNWMSFCNVYSVFILISAIRNRFSASLLSQTKTKDSATLTSIHSRDLASQFTSIETAM